MITIKSFVPTFLQEFNEFLEMEPFTLATVMVLDRGGTYALAAFNTLPQVYGFPQCVWFECTPIGEGGLKGIVKSAVKGAGALTAAGTSFETLSQLYDQSGLGYQKEAEFVREYFITCMKIGSDEVPVSEGAAYFNRRWLSLKGEHVPG